MIRLLHLLAMAALIGSAAYAYSVKYETLFYAEEIQRQKGRLAREHDAIAVAKAEWALLTRPDRLQRMADQHLDLQPISVGQLARLSDLPNRQPKSDEIARLMGTEAPAPARGKEEQPAVPRPVAPTASAKPKAPAAPKVDEIARLLGTAPVAATVSARARSAAEPTSTGSLPQRPLPR